MSDLVLASVPILSSALGKWYLTGQSRIWQIVPFEKVGRKMFLISQCSLLCSLGFFFPAFLGGRETDEGSRAGKLKIISCFHAKI